MYVAAVRFAICFQFPEQLFRVAVEHHPVDSFKYNGRVVQIDDFHKRKPRRMVLALLFRQGSL